MLVSLSPSISHVAADGVVSRGGGVWCESLKAADFDRHGEDLPAFRPRSWDEPHVLSLLVPHTMKSIPQTADCMYVASSG